MAAFNVYGPPSPLTDTKTQKGGKSGGPQIIFQDIQNSDFLSTIFHWNIRLACISSKSLNMFYKLPYTHYHELSSEKYDLFKQYDEFFWFFWFLMFDFPLHLFSFHQNMEKNT